LRLFFIAHRIIRGGCRHQLRLAASWPWARQTATAITRLQVPHTQLTSPNRPAIRKGLPGPVEPRPPGGDSPVTNVSHDLILKTASGPASCHSALDHERSRLVGAQNGEHRRILVPEAAYGLDAPIALRYIRMRVLPYPLEVATPGLQSAFAF
jgi:hypothetical protein